MAHILIIIALSGYGPRPIMHTQEFSSKENCVAAATAIGVAWPKIDGSKVMVAMCMEK